MNNLATREMTDHLAAFPTANPWHVCFAFGLSWGHLAKLELAFTEACVNVLTSWNAADLQRAQSYHMERGPEPIGQSLTGAQILFGKVTLPVQLPSTLKQFERAQGTVGASPILNPSERPPYIGAWNATAMFMTELCLRSRRWRRPMLVLRQDLPPGRPIYAGLMLLNRAGVLSRSPAGSDLDDAAFEPGAIYENNGLLAEPLRAAADWSLIDVHSGVYMLGTRHPHSDTWA